jgi:transketolase
MEGISQEAIAIAGHLKLNRLIVLWDDNGISIDGPLSVCAARTPACESSIARTSIGAKPSNAEALR